MVRFVCVSSLALAMTCAASAAPITFFGVLSGANENPATGSPGTGNATVTFDSTTQLLTVNVLFSGLGTGTTAAHIHCCVAVGGDAGVATTTPSFTGFPLGVTSGTFLSSLDLTSSSSFNPAFVTANGGTVASAETALITGMESGMTYLNIHTTAFPGGEIRAFLEPVPEPRFTLLAAAAIFGSRLLCRKRCVR